MWLLHAASDDREAVDVRLQRLAFFLVEHCDNQSGYELFRVAAAAGLNLQSCCNPSMSSYDLQRYQVDFGHSDCTLVIAATGDKRYGALQKELTERVANVRGAFASVQLHTTGALLSKAQPKPASSQPIISYHIAPLHDGASDVFYECCSFCKAVFDVKSNRSSYYYSYSQTPLAQRHFQQEHFTCQQCAASCPVKASLDEHCTVIQCNRYGTTISCKRRLEEHNSQHDRQDAEQRVRNEELRRQQELRQKQEEARAEAESRWNAVLCSFPRCPRAKKPFTSPEARRQHESAAHKGAIAS